jgi:hypothetical protein
MKHHAAKWFSTFLAAAILIMGSHAAILVEESENKQKSPSL